MIKLKQISKYHYIESSKKRKKDYHIVFENLNISFNSNVGYAIMGKNGSGKSTLIRMMAGSLLPTKGEIIRKGTVSWPIGFSGAFQSSLSAAENINFITKIYAMDEDKRKEAIEFCKEFANIGKHFYMPVKSYSSGMRARVSFAMSMVCEFDCYLLDEITATGDMFFVKKARELLYSKLSKKSFICTSHNIGDIRDLCKYFGVIYNKTIKLFDHFNEAYKFYKATNIYL